MSKELHKRQHRSLSTLPLCDSMGMAVTVFVRSRTDGYNASIADLADIEFELDRRVMDLEALA